jgi:hypothetical protein
MGQKCLILVYDRRQTRGSKMSWKSSFKDLEKAFNYAKEHKTVSPEELAKKFGITKGESAIIIEWFTWERFAESIRKNQRA